MWELQFNSKGVVDSTGIILKFKFVSVLVKFENLENFSVDIEIFFLFVSNGKFSSSVSTFDASFGEVVKGPLLEGRLDGSVLFLVSGSLSREGIWSFSGSLTGWDGFVGGVKSP